MTWHPPLDCDVCRWLEVIIISGSLKIDLLIVRTTLPRLGSRLCSGDAEIDGVGVVALDPVVPMEPRDCEAASGDRNRWA